MRYLSIAVAVTTLVASAWSAVAQPAQSPNPSPSVEQHLLANGYRPVVLTKLRTGHETVQVTLNGVTGTFVLDSGAGGSVVHLASRDKFGLPEQGNSVGGTGAGGRITLVDVPIQTLLLGDVAVPQTRIAVTDLSSVVNALQAATGVTIDGVIGQDILTRDGGIIDVRAQRLYLQIDPDPR